MKDMVPNRADNKAADLIRAVSKSALQLHMWLGCTDPRRTGSPAPGEWVPASLSQLEANSPSRKDLGLFTQREAGCESGLWFKMALAAVCSHVCTWVHVYTQTLPSFVTPNSPENYPVITAFLRS